MVRTCGNEKNGVVCGKKIPPTKQKYYVLNGVEVPVDICEECSEELRRETARYPGGPGEPKSKSF
jgi:hypothetical protein